MSATTYHKWRSPLGRRVEVEEREDKLYRHEVRELLRGFCGALFVALPLLYTQEMWERARNIDEAVLIAIMVGAYVITVGYISYSGFKTGRTRTQIFWDAATAMGLGLVASIVTLYITARVTLDTPLAVLVCLLALMVVPTGFGAALAINQLGKRGGGGEDGEDSVAVELLGKDWEKLLATALGGTLFAFNIVPTIEPKVMLADIGPKHALAILVFSVMVSYGINYTAQFHKRRENHQGVLSSKWLSTLVCYLVSLLTSAAWLWAFGYLGLDTPLRMAIVWVIIVGYATTLGGAAGRLVL
ncbi:DUF2391 family protein [uncultured Algimonas sp.]|uniref:DUF2391 family protein n=1 Tax=uncultured Algimonas sp. TaxID=1547920 RepID=UPI00262D08FA|nr:DUF2391 family protein [uncultured Algimonas sp.]